MNRKNSKSILAIVLVLLLGMACLTGCGSDNAGSTAGNNPSASAVGKLYVKVNPEISVSYDEQGNTTAVVAENKDAEAIIQDYTDYLGKPCKEVVTEIVALIGGAGYFVEEVEGVSKQITIEVAKGSAMPYDTFMDDVVYDVRECVSENAWHSPVATQGESDYGQTDYVDTDYGPENDGITDYDDTDYGPNNDGITDFDDQNSNYNDQNSNYSNQNSNYDDQTSNYNDQNSNYDNQNTNYDDQSSNYDNQNTNYDDQTSNYSDQNSNYDNQSSNYNASDYDN